MALQLRSVDKAQSFDNVADQRILEIPVQGHLLLLKDVLQAASWTILCDEESLTGVNASTNKSDQVLVLQVFHPFQVPEQSFVQANIMCTDLFQGHSRPLVVTSLHVHLSRGWVQSVP